MRPANAIERVSRSRTRIRSITGRACRGSCTAERLGRAARGLPLPSLTTSARCGPFPCDRGAFTAERCPERSPGSFAGPVGRPVLEAPAGRGVVARFWARAFHGMPERNVNRMTIKVMPSRRACVRSMFAVAGGLDQRPLLVHQEAESAGRHAQAWLRAGSSSKHRRTVS